jgi:hypothetical protein
VDIFTQLFFFLCVCVLCVCVCVVCVCVPVCVCGFPVTREFHTILFIATHPPSPRTNSAAQARIAELTEELRRLRAEHTDTTAQLKLCESRILAQASSLERERRLRQDAENAAKRAAAKAAGSADEGDARDDTREARDAAATPSSRVEQDGVGGYSALTAELQSTVASLTRSLSALTRERDVLVSERDAQLRGARRLLDVVGAWRREIESLDGGSIRKEVGLAPPGNIDWQDRAGGGSLDLRVHLNS